MLNKVIKVSIIAGVLIIGFSVLYYFTIFLPSKERARLEQQARDNKERKFNAINLDLCLEEAEQIDSKNRKIISELGKSCENKTTLNERLGCWEGVNQSFDKADITLQQDKNNCFKRYPQR